MLACVLLREICRPRGRLGSSSLRFVRAYLLAAGVRYAPIGHSGGDSFRLLCGCCILEVEPFSIMFNRTFALRRREQSLSFFVRCHSFYKFRLLLSKELQRARGGVCRCVHVWDEHTAVVLGASSTACACLYQALLCNAREALKFVRY